MKENCTPYIKFISREYKQNISINNTHTYSTYYRSYVSQLPNFNNLLIINSLHILCTVLVHDRMITPYATIKFIKIILEQRAKMNENHFYIVYDC